MLMITQKQLTKSFNQIMNMVRHKNNEHTTSNNNISDIVNDNNNTTLISQHSQAHGTHDNIQVDQELKKIISPENNQKSINRKFSSSIHYLIHKIA
jgi:hypothetical protein